MDSSTPPELDFPFEPFVADDLVDATSFSLDPQVEEDLTHNVEWAEDVTRNEPDFFLETSVAEVTRRQRPRVCSFCHDRDMYVNRFRIDLVVRVLGFTGAPQPYYALGPRTDICP